MEPNLSPQNQQPPPPPEKPVTPTGPRVDVNNIYSSPDQYRNQRIQDNSLEENIPDTLDFKRGYSIGGKIFWHLLIAGFIMALVSYGITASISDSHNSLLISSYNYLVWFVYIIVILYVINRVLRSNDIEGSFWLTLFGIALQSFIGVSVGIVAFIIKFAIIALVANSHATQSSLLNAGEAVAATIEIVLYVGFILASYFLMKLFWGITFSLFGKIKNKTIVKIIDIAFITLLLLSIATSCALSLLYRSSVATKLTTSYSSNSSQVNSLKTYTPAGSRYEDYVCNIITIATQGNGAVIIVDQNGDYRCKRQFVTDQNTKFYKSSSSENPVNLSEFFSEFNRRLSVANGTYNYVAADIHVNGQDNVVISVRFY